MVDWDFSLHESIMEPPPLMSYTQHAISYILPASFFAVTEKLHTFAEEITCMG